MIRSSALLTVVAMAVLVAGVSAASLGLIYLSIAVSILATVTLAVGVLLRRREIFGAAGAAPRSAQPGWAAAETAKARPVPVRPAAGDRVTVGRGGRPEDNWRDGEQHSEQQGDLAARQQKAASGTAADTGSARWPASIAAKGAPATARRGSERPGGRGRAARPPSGREPVPTGSTGRGAGWPPRPGREAGPGRPAEPGRDRAGAGRDQGSGRGQDPAAARPDRQHAAQEQERGETAAGQQAEAFGLPPQSERIRARAEELGRAMSGDPSGNEFWDRVSEEFAESRSQEPVRPAWPATAGPRARGTGSAARRAPGETGDELEAGAGAEPRWDRVVPPYVDDLARRGRQQREPEREPVGADEPDDDAARTGATAWPAASSAWSAWSSTRTRDQDAGADAEQAGQPTEVGVSGDHGDAGADETADRAEPGGAAGPSPAGEAPSDAERSADADGAGDAGESDGAAGADADGSTSLDDEVTVVPGVPRYHRRGCILIRFLSDGDLETPTRREAQAAGSVPCKACQPDKPASDG